MRQKKIMVVDDSSDLLAIAKFGVTVVGKNAFVGVSSGTDAVAIAAREKPDAILLDVVMPDLDGPSTLKALKNDPETSQIPVIFLTAGGLGRFDQDVESMGAIGMIEKPFDPMKLSSLIENLLASP